MCACGVDSTSYRLWWRSLFKIHQVPRKAENHRLKQDSTARSESLLSESVIPSPRCNKHHTDNKKRVFGTERKLVPDFVFWSHLIPTAARYRRFPMTKVWEVPKTGLHQHLKGKCNFGLFVDCSLPGFDTVWYRLISTFQRNMLSQFSGLGPGWRGSDFGENVLLLYRLQRFEKCGQTLQTCSGTVPDRPIQSVSYSDGTYFEYQSDSRLTCWISCFFITSWKTQN